MLEVSRPDSDSDNRDSDSDSDSAGVDSTTALVDNISYSFGSQTTRNTCACGLDLVFGYALHAEPSCCIHVAILHVLVLSSSFASHVTELSTEDVEG